MIATGTKQLVQTLAGLQRLNAFGRYRRRTGPASSILPAAGAFGLGVTLMYFLDPNRGKRRRKLVGDQLVHTGHVLEEALGKTTRDFRNRAIGATAGVKHRLSRGQIDDRVLVERVRAALGRVVSHPSALEVSSEDGIVSLSGPILEHELDRLLSRVEKVRGVRGVENQLELHSSGEGVPGLQGGVPRTGDQFELRQENWTPAARVLTTAAGGVLAAYGMRTRNIAGAALGLAGAALATRGATNKPLKRVAGVGAGRKAVNVQKTINIDAPPEHVFAFCTDYENWPQFMTNVKEVRQVGPGLQHWKVEGPAGRTFEWDSEITRFIPNELVSWKTADGAIVKHAGIMRFDPNPDGGTRIHVQMSYNPPAGALGHTLATLFGADPKRQMDEDLSRLKTSIETGIPPHDAAAKELH